MKKLIASETARLSKCFAPECAAIIGASVNPMKFGGRALKFCLERGYRGRLYPVNAKNKIVQGMEAFQHVRELPEIPDIAVIAVPAPLVRENLIAVAEMGCGVAIVYGAQFAESGEEGAGRQHDLLRIATANGMRLIGPNCMGVISLASGFVASFTSAPEHHGGNGWPEIGNVSVASQSGAVGIQIFAQLRDRGLGLANWISTGNQADIDVADAIAYYADDPETKTIAVYMEDASRGFKLIQALELARQAKKPVVVLKVGVTPEGGRAAVGHTASMYVPDRVVEDVFAQFGALRARSINELIDLTAACNAGIIPSSPNVAAVSVSGGGAVMISDAAAKNGLNLVDYSASALAKLKAENPFVNDRNPIDISAPSMSNMKITGGHLKWGLEQNVPTMIGYISHVPMVPRTRTGIMPQLLSLQAAHPEQLIAIAANLIPKDRKELVQTGIALFDDPSIATEVVAKLVKAGQAFQNPAMRPSEPNVNGNFSKLLKDAGINMAEAVVVQSADQATALLDGPLVLKLSAPTLRHRTELSGVETGLVDEMQVRHAYDRLSSVVDNYETEFPGLCITVSSHINGVEVLIGVKNDPNFGPLVVLGSGGVDCEILDDLIYRKAPFGLSHAAAMVDSLKVSPKFNGWRGTPPVSRNALEQVLVALSEQAHRMPTFEINPLFVTEVGVIGADLVIAEEVEE